VGENFGVYKHSHEGPPTVRRRGHQARKTNNSGTRIRSNGGNLTVKKYESDALGITTEIDHDKCIGAGECVDVCPTEVFELVDGKATAPNIDECIECCACVEACPTQAIKHTSC